MNFSSLFKYIFFYETVWAICTNAFFILFFVCKSLGVYFFVKLKYHTNVGTSQSPFHKMKSCIAFKRRNLRLAFI